MDTKAKQPLTHNAAHYLISINQLVTKNGYARLTDIAKSLDISPGSCLTTLKKLKKKGWVKEDENKFYQLSDQAEAKVILINKNKELVQDFLEKVLEVSPKQAEKDACAIEHLISLESSFKLARFMNCVGKDDETSKGFLENLKNEKYVCWREFSFNSESEQ